MKLALLLGCLLVAPLASLSPFAAAQAMGPAADYSGMYSFIREGEFIQITIEDKGTVSGFISRFGDSESDHGAFLDQFFKTGKFGEKTGRRRLLRGTRKADPLQHRCRKKDRVTSPASGI
jgi:hypothetical protein